MPAIVLIASHRINEGFSRPGVISRYPHMIDRGKHPSELISSDLSKPIHHFSSA
jgi:hypothetical protein